MIHVSDDSCIPQSSSQETLADRLRLWTPAKINLNLLVGSARADGYHPVDSCIAKITLYDCIDLHRRDDGNISLTCEGVDCGAVKENLAYRAAALLAEGRDAPGVEIRLVKKIPPGGGLGGGSSDAAAVLAGLNAFWKCNLSNDQLRELAARLGSDVPLFLGPASCRATGRGEILEPLDVFPFWAVLILSRLHCSTGAVYRAFDAMPTPQDKQLDTRLFTQPPSQWREQLANHLAQPAFHVCPPLRQWHERLSTLLPMPVHVTGSGSSLFVLCDDKEEAHRVAKVLPDDVKKLTCLVQKNAW